MQQKTNTWLYDTVLITALCTIAYLLFLGTRALGVPDEARYSEIALEMLNTHQFIVPHLDGIKYFEKPPLFFWLQSGAIHLFQSQSTFILRLPNMLMAILGILFTYIGGRWLFDRSTGILSSLILSSSLFYFAMAHTVSLDMSLSTLLNGSLICFLAGTQVSGARRRNLIWIAFTLSALAVLTKGLIGIFFPIMIVGIWIALQCKWKELKQWHLFSGLLLWLLIAAPWHVFVQRQEPEFFHFYFVSRQFLRFSSNLIHYREAWWYFLPVAFAGFIPWICFLPQALHWHFTRINAQSRSTALFLFIWASTILLVFSFSHSKLLPYILPMFMPLAILCGNYLSQTLKQKRKRGLIIGFCALTILSIVIAIGFVLFKQHIVTNQPFLFILIVSASLVIWLLGTINSTIQYIRSELFSAMPSYRRLLPARAAHLVPFATLMVTTLIACIGILFSTQLILTDTTKPIATILNKRMIPGDRIVSYSAYHQDLPLYTGKKIMILSWRNELDFGANYTKNADKTLINADQFRALLNDTKTTYIVVSKKRYPRLIQQYPNIHFKRIGKSAHNYLLIKQKEGTE
jgi:4-amino-4-deoxy-L-arabinose transferase-like glycosyltransferase